MPSFKVQFDRGDDVEYVVSDRYSHDGSEGLGQGAFGAVCSAVDAKSGKPCAIKKNFNVFSSGSYKAAVRELQLLDHFTSSGKSPHPNIVSIIDVFVLEGDTQESMDDVYFVLAAYDCSLRGVLKDEELCGQLTLKRRSSMMMQLLSGLQAIHTAGCLHRDIKPENVLIRGVDFKGSSLAEEPELAICDLGSGRAVDIFVTQDVLVTTWPYVAPEALIESPQNPWSVAKDAKTKKDNPQSLDTWSAACIWGEMLAGEQMFPEAKFGPAAGLQKMAKVLGAPTGGLMEKVQDPRMKEGLQKLGDGRSFEKHMEEGGLYQSDDNPDGATPAEAELVTKMLAMDPNVRAGVEEALAHKFFADAKSPPACTIPEFKAETRSDLGADEARGIVWGLIAKYK